VVKGRATIGFIGIGIGAIALLMAIVHFWAGPVSPQPSLEKTVAEKAVAIRDATVAALKGEAIEDKKVSRSSFDLDDTLRITTSVLGGLAIILGVVSLATREPFRVAGGAAVLGGSALAFQFAVLALGLIFLAILTASVVSQLGFD
jgi:hypothetical protein